MRFGVLLIPTDPWPQAVRRARYLESLGLVVEHAPHVFDTWGYLAGRDEDRLGDLNAAIRDPAVRAIIATRGGKGAYRIADGLDNIDAVCVACKDVPNSTLRGEIGEFLCMMENTTKPLEYLCEWTRSLEAAIEMAAALRGGRAELAEKPYFLHIVTPLPLCYAAGHVEQIMIAARAGVPNRPMASRKKNQMSRNIHRMRNWLMLGLPPFSFTTLMPIIFLPTLWPFMVISITTWYNSIGKSSNIHTPYRSYMVSVSDKSLLLTTDTSISRAIL